MRKLTSKEAEVIADEVAYCMGKIQYQLPDTNVVSSVVGVLLYAMKEQSTPEKFKEYMSELYIQYTKDIKAC